MQTLQIGRWLFVVGIILSVIAGFLTALWPAVVLMILGLIVGFLNITHEETTKYLIAVIALLTVAFAATDAIQLLGEQFTVAFDGVLINFMSFIAASALVVAIKAIWELGEK